MQVFQNSTFYLIRFYHWSWKLSVVFLEVTDLLLWVSERYLPPIQVTIAIVYLSLCTQWHQHTTEAVAHMLFHKEPCTTVSSTSALCGPLILPKGILEKMSTQESRFNTINHTSSFRAFLCDTDLFFFLLSALSGEEYSDH